MNNITRKGWILSQGRIIPVDEQSHHKNNLFKGYTIDYPYKTSVIKFNFLEYGYCINLPYNRPDEKQLKILEDLLTLYFDKDNLEIYKRNGSSILNDKPTILHINKDYTVDMVINKIKLLYSKNNDIIKEFHVKGEN